MYLSYTAFISLGTKRGGAVERLKTRPRSFIARPSNGTNQTRSNRRSDHFGRTSSSQVCSEIRTRCTHVSQVLKYICAYVVFERINTIRAELRRRSYFGFCLQMLPLSLLGVFVALVAVVSPSRGHDSLQNRALPLATSVEVRQTAMIV